MRNQITIGCLCAIGCETIYGLSYIFTKQATSNGSALALLGWRFLVALIIMSALVAFGVIKVNYRGKRMAPLIMVAFFCPLLYFLGETIGIAQTTASESGVFLACIPVASLVASTLILKKKPARRQVIGIVITLVGVVITVVAVGVSTSLSVIGYAFLLLGVGSYALYSVYVEKADGFSGAEITYAMIIAGAVAFITVALGSAIVTGTLGETLMLPFESSQFLMAVIYQGICCSIMAFFLSNVAISKIGVNKTSSFIGISTVVSIVAGIFMLGEPFSSMQMVGAVIILIGVYVANVTLKQD